MNTRPFRIAPGLFAAAALALAGSASAQTPPPSEPSPAATSPQPSPRMGHHRPGATSAKHGADMKAECDAMVARKQEMEKKVQAMDATLDKLVAEMNAAKAAKEVGALERPMAAVLNELVVQRKALRSMMMDMQPAMMEHMAQHMHMQGEMGAMECPMMKTGKTPEPGADKKPSM